MEAIIFDMDGVLVDSMRVHMRIWKIIFEKRGLTFNLEEFKRYNGTSSKQIAEKLIAEHGFDEDPGTIIGEKLLLEKKFQDEINLFPQALEVLQELRKRYRLAIATSARKEMLEYIDSRFGLTSFFDAAVHSDMVERTKPEPDIFLRAAEELRTDPSCCGVVEDAVNGILAARVAGMTAIAITNTFPRDSFPMADHIINQLSDLHAIE
ncbi:MAG: HAD family hydrolase [Nanobdellota archaeon]